MALAEEVQGHKWMFCTVHQSAVFAVEASEFAVEAVWLLKSVCNTAVMWAAVLWEESHTDQYGYFCIPSGNMLCEVFVFGIALQSRSKSCRPISL